MARVNVGCGHFPIPGYLNIDLFEPADRVGDFRQMRFDGLDEVLMSHVLEHLPWRQTPRVLSLVFGWLRPGGLLTVEVPDMREILSLGTGYPMWQQYVYGSQDHAGEFHKAGFTRQSLGSVLRDAGFEVERVRVFLSDHPMRPGFPCLEALARRPL